MNRRDFLRTGGVAGIATLGRAVAPPWVLAGAAESATGDADSATLWLNWNENPGGLSGTARRAVQEAISRAHRYPDRERAELAAKLAATHGVGADAVVLGCGSTEILQMIVQFGFSEGALLLLAEPSFEAVLRYQEPLGYRVEKVPLDGRFAHDVQRMKERIGRRAALVYVCNPNNPTGTLTPSSELDLWIQQAPETTLFAVDEAYYEYVQSPSYWSAVKWISERPNVVVTRTFSKIYGMAGLRLGYALAHPQTARRLRTFMSADNANGCAIAAAMASLDETGLLPRSRATNEQAKRIALEVLEELGLGCLPSHTNFLMHRVPGDLGVYIRRMAEHGIRVGRPFPPLLSYSRLSLGLPTEMEQWAATLRDFRSRGWI